MINKEQLSTFRTQLKGIFALRVSRSTFREVQNAALAIAPSNEEDARNVFESLITGKLKKGLFEEDCKRLMQGIIDEFCIPLRLSKEVAERGEFISLISSDAIKQQDATLFVNRLRRVDGDEFHFVSDMPSTVHLLGHLVDRMTELKQSTEGQQALGSQKDALEALMNRLKTLV